jgi:hypothetical protein
MNTYALTNQSMTRWYYVASDSLHEAIQQTGSEERLFVWWIS